MFYRLFVKYINIDVIGLFLKFVKIKLSYFVIVDKFN